MSECGGHMKNCILVLALSFAIALPVLGQSTSNPSPNSDSYPSSPTAIGHDHQSNTPDQSETSQFNYRVNVIQRSTEAVDYRDRGGTTQVDFKGTSLMPEADGKAKVTGHTGRLAIDASVHHLKPARDFGPEYLTYVLWAITPEGRATNLGEVVPNGDGTANLQITTGL